MRTLRKRQDRRGDLYLAVGHRRQPKKRTQGDGGSRLNLAAARGWLTRRAIPAPRKEHDLRDQAGTMLYEEPLKDERSGKDVGHNRNATMA
jgi:hypothetical protein